MTDEDHIHLGIKGHVVCLRKHDGRERWRTRLKGSDLVCVVVEPDGIYAYTHGSAYALDADTGAIRWRNDLPRLGFGFAVFATAGQMPVAAAAKRREAAAGAGATGSS